MRYHVKSVEKVNLASITSYCAKQGKGLLNCPWPSVTVKLHGRENPMNTHLTNGRIVYLLQDYAGSSVCSPK